MKQQLFILIFAFTSFNCLGVASSSNNSQDSSQEEGSLPESTEDEVGVVDSDRDGFGDKVDNCRSTFNPTQLDSNQNGIGDFCEGDFDNDGIISLLDLDALNAAFNTGNPIFDLDGDGIVAGSDLVLISDNLGRTVARQIDTDIDAIADWRDNCPGNSNTYQVDSNSNGIGDACEGDFNNDGIIDNIDFDLFEAELGGTNPVFDINGDGSVGVADFSIFNSNLNKFVTIR